MKHSISINNKATSTYHSAGLHSLFSSFFSSFIKLISISIGQSIISCKKPKSILSILNLISQEALPDIPTSHPCSARLLLLLLLMDAKTMLNQFLQSGRYGFQFFFFKIFLKKLKYIYIYIYKYYFSTPINFMIFSFCFVSFS
jgi:hypothetical protein